MSLKTIAFLLGIIIIFFFASIYLIISNGNLIDGFGPKEYFGTLGLLFLALILSYHYKEELTILFIFITYFFFLVSFNLPFIEVFLYDFIIAFWLLITANFLFSRRIYKILANSISVCYLLLFRISINVWGTRTRIPDFPDFISIVFGFLLMQGSIIYFVGIYKKYLLNNTIIDTLNTSINQLIKANVGFQDYANKVSKESILKERKRISREIHDSVGHKLVNLIMMVQESLDCYNKKERLHFLLRESHKEAKEALDSTRMAVRLLRREELQHQNLGSILYQLSSTFQNATGIDVDLELGNISEEVDSTIAGHLYSILQESFTNAIRHGHASMVQVRTWKIGKNLLLYISDNGRGANRISEGVGLQSMKERVASMNASIDIKTKEGEGFQVKIEIPMGK